MPDRNGHSFKLLTTSGLATAMLALGPATGWPQAGPQPTLGLQSPAQQSVPAQPAPQ